MNIRKSKKNNGITLIALVITIIVMLILVAVTINMAINGGLFEKAGEAVGDTKNEINKEQTLANGQITVGDKTYASIDDYLAGKVAVLPYDETAKDENGILKANATYTVEREGTAVVPKGFKVIPGLNGRTSISDGLVIQDASGNEFVWIPVTTDLGSSYSSSSNYSEPKELKNNYSSSSAAYDSQTTLNYLYGANYYNYAEDFKYADEYAEMVRCVNENHGFYIGRYETTIDNGSIGSKYNTTVLTAGTTLFTKDSKAYPYRWYGLYYASKNANVTGNGEDVQTAMIYGVLWDKAMDFIRTQKAAGKTTYNVDSATSTWHGSSNGHTGVVNSGQANKGTPSDVALNIWDLESNAYEWTQEALSSSKRVSRGGGFGNSYYASSRGYNYPTSNSTGLSSRLALYIK